jgi:hypothetical protein
LANEGEGIPPLAPPPPHSPVECYDAIIAYDTEYRQIGNVNLILSYQCTTLVQVEGVWRMGEFIYYPQNGERLSAARVLGVAGQRVCRWRW